MTATSPERADTAMGHWQLAPCTSFAALQHDTHLLIDVGATAPTPCWTGRIAQSPLLIFPPEYNAEWQEAHQCPEHPTPMYWLQSFNVRGRLTSIVVRDAHGPHHIRVRQIGPTELIERLSAREMPAEGTATPTPREGVGYSDSFSLEEAIREAAYDLEGVTNPDIGMDVAVTYIGAEIGGFVGRHRLMVRVTNAHDGHQGFAIPTRQDRLQGELLVYKSSQIPYTGYALSLKELPTRVPNETEAMALVDQLVRAEGNLVIAQTPLHPRLVALDANRLVSAQGQPNLDVIDGTAIIVAVLRHKAVLPGGVGDHFYLESDGRLATTVPLWVQPKDCGTADSLDRKLVEVAGHFVWRPSGASGAWEFFVDGIQRI